MYVKVNVTAVFGPDLYLKYFFTGVDYLRTTHCSDVSVFSSFIITGSLITGSLCSHCPNETENRCLQFFNGSCIT
jgi:hypothetical protein